MITVFTCPKRFDKKIGLIQANAINSWKNLNSKIQVILIGNDETVKSFAKNNNMEFIEGVKSNKYETPYVNSIFELAEKNSRYDILVYINSDIILFDDFIRTVKTINNKIKRFFIVGQRFDLELNKLIDFSNTNSVRKLYSSVCQRGKKHGHTGMDYFVFKRHSLGKIPEFLIGRDGWDNWMIYNALARGLKVIDATKSITVLHQNHDYSHLTQKKKHDEELSNNLFAKGKRATLFDATYKIDNNYNVRKKSPVKRSVVKRYHDLKFLVLHLYKKH